MSLIGLLLRGFGGSPGYDGETTDVLTHSPAEILQQLLINKLEATDPADGLDWPVFVSVLPTRPENVLTCNDSDGRTQGRLQYSGKVPTHPGIQILLRSSNPNTGFAKLCSIGVTLTRSVVRELVTVEGVDYTVHSLTQIGEVRSLGRETAAESGGRVVSDCQLYSLNVLMSVKQVA